MSPFGAKIVFVSQLGLSTSFCATSRKSRFIVKNFKDAASGKIFDLMNDFGETEMPKGQRIAKFLVLSEGNVLYTLKV